VAEKVTVPLPLPLAPPVTVSHVAPLVALHAHPVAAVTVTVPVDAPAPSEADVDDSTGGAQDDDSAKVLDSELAIEPPGPMAVTRASYVTPCTSGVASRVSNLTLISPLLPI